ncbi:MAG: SDR family NAD(P)-dependent oxidoreductase [Chlamydiales bacterium]|nr:SDR family NAD(P)-dependent oxidoreductase [Chlamydiales bacterium]
MMLQKLLLGSLMTASFFLSDVEPLFAETVVVIGGNRGIGLGFVQYYLSRPEYSVIATYRDPERVSELLALEERYPDRIRIYQLDVTDEEAITHFATNVTEGVDILVLNAGIVRGAPRSHPPQNTAQEARELMEVNAYAPDNIMRALYLKLLKPHSCAVYITSTLSHHGSNITGRTHHYRASKAAGNMLIQDWNIELARLWVEEMKGDYRTRPCAFPISPGLVKTDMSGPNSNAPLTVEQSVKGMTAVITEVRQGDKQCSLRLYDGSTLEPYPDPLVVTNAKKDSDLHD